MKVDDGEDAKFIEEGLFGDQLTIERCINAAQSRKNGYSTEERLEGFHWGVADWHAGLKACTVSLCRHFVFTIFHLYSIIYNFFNTIVLYIYFNLVGIQTLLLSCCVR